MTLDMESIYKIQPISSDGILLECEENEEEDVDEDDFDCITLSDKEKYDS